MAKSDFPKSGSPAPRVAMMVANDVTIDGRVKKTAAAVDALGLPLLLLGRAPGKRQEIALGSIPLVLVEDRGVLTSSTQKGLSGSRRTSIKRDVLALGTRRRPTLDEYAFARSRRKLQLRLLSESYDRRIAEEDGRVERTFRLEARTRQIVNRVRQRYLQRSLRQIDRSYARDSPRTNGRTSDLSLRVRNAQFQDWELAFGPELDKFSPDIVHVHDVHLLGVAVRYKLRRSRKGKNVHVIYDAHEYIRGQIHIYGESHRAMIEHENRYISFADRVITVSERLASWLIADHHLDPSTVFVTLNTPSMVALGADHAVPVSLRETVGLLDETPLVVYSGGQSDARGIPELVDAVQELEDVHLALVAHPTNRYATAQRRRAIESGFGGRVHVVPFVEPERVSEYLASADLAVHPIRRYFEGTDGVRTKILNHEGALTNKLFEYLHAGLPIVTSDCAASADFVRHNDIGVVFRSPDSSSLRDAISRAIAHRDTLGKNITEELKRSYSWEAQCDQIYECYRSLGLLNFDSASSTEAFSRALRAGLESQISTNRGQSAPAGTAADLAKSLVIGPINTADQGTQWAAAVRRYTSHLAQSLMMNPSTDYGFPADLTISRSAYASLNWQVEQARSLPYLYSHVLVESGLSMLGSLNGGKFFGDLDYFKAQGIELGLVFHGSDIRDPRHHAEREAHSPFREELDGLTNVLIEKVTMMKQLVERFDGPVFCSTPDLLREVAGSFWLPAVVDVDRLAVPNFEWNTRRPRVLYAPSRSALKGTDSVEESLIRLDEAGLIAYTRIHRASHSDYLLAMKSADIILDQFRIGAYGVTAVEALAAGKVVIGHVADEIRKLFNVEIPIVEANIDDLASVLAEVVRSIEDHSARSAERVAYSAEFHDGRLASQQLDLWLRGQVPDVMPTGIHEGGGSDDL